MKGTRRAKSRLNCDGFLLMKFNQGQLAEKKWEQLIGFDCQKKVIDGILFKDRI